MENKNNMGVFNEIFNACAELETLYAEKSKNFIKNFLDERAIKKSYEYIYKQINVIDSNPVIPETLFDGYLDCLGSSRSSFGMCRRIMRNRELYIASFEFKLPVPRHDTNIIVDVTQVNNGGFGNVISMKFHIVINKVESHQFSIGYSDMIFKREDEVNLSDEEKGVVRIEKIAMDAFSEKLKEDIYLFLKEFVDNSKNRLERKRGENAK